MKDESIKKAVDELLGEAGEMGWHDIKPGGENYEWAEYVRKAAEKLAELTNGVYEFKGVRPFDQYQGPYASGSIGSSSAKLWSSDVEDEFQFDSDGLELTGTVEEIADAINQENKPDELG